MPNSSDVSGPGRLSHELLRQQRELRTVALCVTSNVRSSLGFFGLECRGHVRNDQKSPDMKNIFCLEGDGARDRRTFSIIGRVARRHAYGSCSPSEMRRRYDVVNRPLRNLRQAQLRKPNLALIVDLVKDALSDECYLMGRDADEGTSSYTEISIAGGGSLKVFDAAKRPQLDRRQFLPSLSLVRFALRTRRPSMTALRLSSSNPLVRGRSRVQFSPPAPF